MSLVTSLYLYLAIYVLILVGVSYYFSKKQSREDFLISGRNRGGWQIFASKFAAAIGAGYFITYTGFAYEYGLGVFTLLLGIVVGYLLFAYWASPKIHSLSQKNKFYTLGDFVYYRTKSKTSKNLANWLANLILFGWLLIGIVGGAKIISDFGLMSYEFSVLFTSIVVLLYILLAGYKAVIITDAIQSVIIGLLLIVVTFGIVGADNLSSLFDVQTETVDIGTTVAFLLFGVLSVFSSSNFYQLCYAAKTKEKLKHGLGLSVIPIMLAAALLLLIGLFMASSVPGLDSGLVFSEALKEFLPISLLPLGLVLFFAGIMSSADTNVYSISSHSSIDMKGDKVKNIRISAIVLVILTALVALLFSDIIDISIIVGGITVTLSLAMVYLFFNGESSKKFAASCIGGLAGVIVGIVIFGIEPSAAIMVVLGSALGLLWKR